MPKIESFICTMQEMEADLAIITETWITEDDQPTLDDVAEKSGFEFISRPRKKKKGGGIAIVFRRTHLAMTRCRVPNSSYEVAAAIGRRTGQRRKVLAVAAYIPPSYNAN